MLARWKSLRGVGVLLSAILHVVQPDRTTGTASTSHGSGTSTTVALVAPAHNVAQANSALVLHTKAEAE